MANVFIGTSGFSYQHWHKGVFYPKDLKSGKELEYYATHFDTVEINSSFYHLPKPAILKGWYTRSPKNFTFCIKGSRFISHMKKLNACDEPLRALLNRVGELKEKLGVVFFQFPPNFKLDLKRLHNFLNHLEKDRRFAFEFRHASWFCKDTYQLLKKYDCALIIADSPEYPIEEETTANFVYIRFHGHENLYASDYKDTEIKSWAKKIMIWNKKNLDVYAYFNNDAKGHAVNNALKLKESLNIQKEYATIKQ